MNILCIGNSFSQDATRYLHQVSGEELFVRNLYIGGCSLETHMNNIKNEASAYEYQKNGRKLKMTSINDALLKKKWDYVSIQQVSQLSGMPDSYEPYTEFLVNYIKEKCPKAKIVFHRTWAYSDDSTHGGFANYNWETGTIISLSPTRETWSENYFLKVNNNKKSKFKTSIFLLILFITYYYLILFLNKFILFDHSVIPCHPIRVNLSYHL